MRLKTTIFRCFHSVKSGLTQTQSSTSSTPISTEIFTKEDLLNLKQNYLSITIPKPAYNARIRTQEMETALVDLIVHSQEHNPARNSTKGREYIIVDSPVTLSRNLPSISDFFNKVLKDFGRPSGSFDWQITSFEFSTAKRCTCCGPSIFSDRKPRILCLPKSNQTQTGASWWTSCDSD